MEASEVVEASGHIIDSGILNSIFDTVIRHGGSFEVQQFKIGRTNEDPSLLKMVVRAPERTALDELLHDLVPLGCVVKAAKNALTREADLDGCAPVDFYSTTNHQTHVRIAGKWIEVENQRMDACVIIETGRAFCRKLRDVRKGDTVVCGVDGIRVVPIFQDRDRLGFAFMANEVSSERRVEVAVERVAAMMQAMKDARKPIAFVVGPVVVHTGGAAHLIRLIRAGYVQVLLSGNALAVHDIEGAMFNTSLGINVDTGLVVEGGHHHHMRAINAVRRAGGIRQAIEQGILKSGVMYEAVKNDVDYVLAGSIRDDGPLPDTIMDLVEAQDLYSAKLQEVGLVLILASMLHGIGVGNMLPSSVRTICVDINPAVVTKLADRGSAQAVGIVTDTGLFLHQLADQLELRIRN